MDVYEWYKKFINICLHYIIVRGQFFKYNLQQTFWILNYGFSWIKYFYIKWFFGRCLADLTLQNSLRFIFGIETISALQMKKN